MPTYEERINLLASRVYQVYHAPDQTAEQKLDELRKLSDRARTLRHETWEAHQPDLRRSAQDLVRTIGTYIIDLTPNQE